MTGRRYEDMNTLEDFRQNFERCQKSIALAEPVLRKHRMRLGIENHKGWRSAEQAAWLKRVSSEWVGVHFDFGNNVSLCEEPAATLRNLLPYTFACHIKDMAVEPYEDGFLLSEVPLGEGFLDIKGMVATLRQKDPNMAFDLEMITRDPLKIPIFTDKYWVTFDDSYSPLPGRDVAQDRGARQPEQTQEPAPAHHGDESGGAVETRRRLHLRIHPVRAPVPDMSPRLLQRAALACLTFAACLPAATHDHWLKITSANFELYTTAGERAGRDLVRHFEQVRSFFLQAFGSRLSASRPVRIIAFKNEKEYQPYRPNEFATAFFQPGAIHDLIVMSSASSEHYPVAVHEFTHLMIHQSGMELPPWLNEGLAELYSSLEPSGEKILVGQLIPARLHVLRSEPWIPLDTLVAVDHSSPFYNEKSHAGMFYAESWALVHMLNLDPAYRPQLKSLVAALNG